MTDVETQNLEVQRDELAATVEQQRQELQKAKEQIDLLGRHRDQLKAESDRLNPENDALKSQVKTLTESMDSLNASQRESARAIQRATDQLAESAAQNKALNDQFAAARAESQQRQNMVDELNGQLAVLTQKYNRKCASFSTVLKTCMDEAATID